MVSLNRTLVELKCLPKYPGKHPKHALNRTLVELKSNKSSLSHFCNRS